MVLFSITYRVPEHACNDGFGFVDLACIGARYLSGEDDGYLTRCDGLSSTNDSKSFKGSKSLKGSKGSNNSNGFDDFAGNARWPAGTDCPVP